MIFSLLSLASLLTENVAVEDLGTACAWEEEPDDEQSLDDVVHGDPVEDGAGSDGLDEVERAKDNLPSAGVDSMPTQ